MPTADIQSQNVMFKLDACDTVKSLQTRYAWLSRHVGGLYGCG